MPRTPPATTISNLRQLDADIDRYIALRQLQADDAPLFWSLVWQHTRMWGLSVPGLCLGVEGAGRLATTTHCPAEADQQQ